MKKIQFLLPIVLLTILALSGCQKNDTPAPTPSGSIDSTGTVVSGVKNTAELFNSWYLWYKDMPDVDLSSYTDPSKYVDAIRYNKDHWSFVAPLQEILDLIQSGQSGGWGAGFKFDLSDSLRIADVYTDSPMGRDSVARGWMIRSLDGQLVRNMSVDAINQELAKNQVTFGFVLPDSTYKEISIAKGNVVMNTVQYSHVYDTNGEKTGYLVFSDFLEPSVADLDTTFATFKADGVSNLILDLRYNTGGLLSTADSLMSLIAGNKYNNQTYNVQEFNDKHTDANENNVVHQAANSLNLNKIVVITSSSTASASELTISGLMPLYPVTLIGTQTLGKPVGMSIFSDTQDSLAIAPISFRNVNSAGYSDYFDGIPVDYTVYEDVRYPFGDPNELCLKAALNYLSTGSPGTAAAMLKSGTMPSKLLSKGTDVTVTNLYDMKKMK
ncbi:S41 family peptidase [Prolixibacter denitrificans]|uniref:Peptidase S41-like protein n=2 Tax=Prolixibacter denitrificans TaxID=1541063 RepID=A0A2P8CBQ2_9BACT|nr:S41 family peptidase [Prolixibacter denitrificans]PSK82391.1 peptidase S41-like protein [Prolixibacter denitrificans]